MRFAYALILTTGCFSSTAPTPPLQGSTPPAAPASEPPSVKQGTEAGGPTAYTPFETARLPAVSDDGTTIAIAIQDSDGGRGHTNLRIVTKDRRDVELAKQVVLTVDETEAMVGADGKNPKLDERLVEANRWLVALHAKVNLVPMKKLAVQPDEGIGTTFRATGPEVTVEWKASSLMIEHRGKVVVQRTTPESWLVKDRKLDPQMTCSNPAYLSDAWIDTARSVAVLSINYSGTDTCWEPPATLHVVTW